MGEPCIRQIESELFALNASVRVVVSLFWMRSWAPFIVVLEASRRERCLGVAFEGPSTPPANLLQWPDKRLEAMSTAGRRRPLCMEGGVK